MTKSIFIKYLFLAALAGNCPMWGTAQQNAELIIKFNLVANNKPIVIADSNYYTAFDEPYKLSRLKFYVSNVSVGDEKKVDRYSNVFLIDAGGLDSATITIRSQTYSQVSFTLGVDSILNCSGAQDGDLDPLNGMFWTWNSGYIFFKLEGYSDSSRADLQRIEQHVGGYRSPYNTARQIILPLVQELTTKKGGRYRVNINVDIDKYWKGINEIKIADQSLLMTPGALAMKAADNLAQIFSIASVESF